MEPQPSTIAELSSTNNKYWHLTIQFLCKKPITIELLPSDTIDTLIQMIAEHPAGMTRDILRSLVFAGRELRTSQHHDAFSQTVAEYGLTDGSVVYAIHGMRATPYDPTKEKG